MPKDATEKTGEDAEGGGLDFDRLREFVAMNTHVKALDEELTCAKASLEELKQGILDRFAEAGVGSVRIDGKTVYTHRQLWAGRADAVGPNGRPILDEKGRPMKVGDEEFIPAIRDAGLGHFVKETVNTQTLSAWARELDEDEGGMPVLPPELVGKVSVTEKFDVRVRSK